MKSHTARPKFVFAGIGTKGDVLPLAALGQEMVRRGYRAHLLANQGYDALAARHGVTFTPVTVAQTNNLMSSSDNLNQHVFPSYGPTFEYFREQMDQGEALVVVNLDEFSASNLMCDRYHLPLCRIHLAPNRIRSLIRPPWPHNKRLEGRLSAAYRKHRLPHLYSQMARPVSFLGCLNWFRQGLGLARVATTHDIDAAITQRLGFFPGWYAEPAPDWPAGFEVVGFPLPRASTSPSRELTEFVQREGKPIVFTPGTGVVDVERFFEDARQCCEALNMPGVFLSPRFRMPSAGLGSRIVHFDFIELDLVLERAALLIHHGGIGTTARAIQAGVPQIIRPQAYDQFDNGDRVTSLGVGRCLLAEEYSLERLNADARELTSSDDVKRKLEQLQREVRAQDGVVLAADALERMGAAHGGGQSGHSRSRLALAPVSPSLPKRSVHLSSGRRTKFILASIGTQGDLLPILSLAKELTDRGHLCHMLGNAPGAERAAELGVEFSGVSPSLTNNLTTKEEYFNTYIFPSFEPTFRIFERELALGNELVVVNQSNYSATTLMCERYGLPRVRIFLAPAQIRSLEAPALPWKARTSGRLGKAFQRYQLPKIYEGRDKDIYVTGYLNAQRASIGLGPITSLLDHESLIDHNLAFFPDWYAAPASDWPPLDLVGFPPPASLAALPRSLARWLQTHGRPLVFTPGTGVRDVHEFFSKAKLCCNLLDRPGVFLSPHFRQAGIELDDRLLHLDFAELGSLLPRAALLVHHGGIGTTARALHAGIPQIVSPQAFDQPDNGGRVSDLGVGVVIERADLSGETLADTARSLLESEHVAATLRKLSNRIINTPAVSRAADILIQRYAAGPRTVRARVHADSGTARAVS